MPFCRPECAAAIMTAVNALARECERGDERAADQRRADALVDLAIAALHDPRLPKAQGMRPDVQVTVALSTVLGLDEQPGELAGHGPIPASVARRMAADPTGTWRRLVTDPLTGKLLGYGRTTYRPPADLADFVIARDGTCTFPTCARSARRWDSTTASRSRTARPARIISTRCVAATVGPLRICRSSSGRRIR